MSEKIAVNLGNVQKTMFLPLWGRAAESRKDRPMLVDKTALEIIDRLDYDFSTIALNISELSRVAWIMRSICVDEVITNFLGKYPRGTVVNIGCGLDTTFDRIDNGEVTWYDLDLPDVINLRKKFIPETERRKFIPASFLEEGWLDEIHVEAQVLFIAAGVFYYFDEQQIRTFLTRLADRYPGSGILFDVSSPYGIKVANRAVIRRSGLDEKSFLTWGVSSPEVITGWDKRFRLLDTCWYFGEKAQLLPLRTRLFGWLSDRLRIQYMIRLGMSSVG